MAKAVLIVDAGAPSVYPTLPPSQPDAAWAVLAEAIAALDVACSPLSRWLLPWEPTARLIARRTGRVDNVCLWGWSRKGLDPRGPSKVVGSFRSVLRR